MNEHYISITAFMRSVHVKRQHPLIYDIDLYKYNTILHFLMNVVNVICI